MRGGCLRVTFWHKDIHTTCVSTQKTQQKLTGFERFWIARVHYVISCEDTPIYFYRKRDLNPQTLFLAKKIYILWDKHPKSPWLSKGLIKSLPNICPSRWEVCVAATRSARFGTCGNVSTIFLSLPNHPCAVVQARHSDPGIICALQTLGGGNDLAL